MKINGKTIAIQAGALAGAALLATGMIYLMICGEESYNIFSMKQETEKIKKIDSKLDEMRKLIDDKKADAGTLKKLEDLNEKFLSKDQRRRRLLMMGDICLNTYRKERDPREREYEFELAAKYYSRATLYASEDGNIEDKNSIVRRIAAIHLENREWTKALSLFEQSASLQAEPAEQWKVHVQMAECYKNIGQYYNAIQMLTQVIDDSDDRELWAEALRSKADILLEAVNNPKILDSIMSKDIRKAKAISQVASSDPQEIATPQLASEQQKQELAKAQDAEKEKILVSCTELYSDIIEKLPPVNEQVSLSRLGLLKISIYRKDLKNAYKYANIIQNSPATVKLKAETLVLMAQLEEDLGNTKTSVKILETCMTRYPRSTQVTPIFMALYKQYKKLENWTKAFDMCEKIFQNSLEPEIISEMIDELSPDKSMMIQALSASDSKDEYIKRARAMLDYIRDQRAPIWSKVNNRAMFLMAVLLYYSNDYAKAQDQINVCRELMNNSKELVERINYLDLQCALKANSAPPVILVRAKRYLNTNPEGKYYQEALIAMLDAYFNMSLYDSALETSKKIYVDDLMQKRLGKSNPFWLKTVARIGECYGRIGKFDSANTIIRNNYYELINQPFAPEVFLAWAKDAQNRGQSYEAIRRLDVIIPKTVDPEQKVELVVARYMLQLSVGSNKDFENVRELLEAVTASQKLSPELKQKMRRKLYEGLLEYAFRTNSPDTHKLVDSAVKEFTSEYWPQYWVLRSISELFTGNGLDFIRQKHEETLQLGEAMKTPSEETVNFLRKQMELIKNLVVIEESADKLKKERGL